MDHPKWSTLTFQAAEELEGFVGRYALQVLLSEHSNQHVVRGVRGAVLALILRQQNTRLSNVTVEAPTVYLGGGRALR